MVVGANALHVGATDIAPDGVYDADGNTGFVQHGTLFYVELDKARQALAPQVGFAAAQCVHVGSGVGHVPGQGVPGIGPHRRIQDLWRQPTERCPAADMLGAKPTVFLAANAHHGQVAGRRNLGAAQAGQTDEPGYDAGQTVVVTAPGH